MQSSRPLMKTNLSPKSGLSASTRRRQLLTSFSAFWAIKTFQSRLALLSSSFTISGASKTRLMSPQLIYSLHFATALRFSSQARWRSSLNLREWTLPRWQPRSFWAPRDWQIWTWWSLARTRTPGRAKLFSKRLPKTHQSIASPLSTAATTCRGSKARVTTSPFWLRCYSGKSAARISSFTRISWPRVSLSRSWKLSWAHQPVLHLERSILELVVILGARPARPTLPLLDAKESRYLTEPPKLLTKKQLKPC